MEKIICEGVQLDYTNLYSPEEVVTFDATIVLEKEDGEWFVVEAVAEEDNEVFGVRKGESFDPGNFVDVDQLLQEYAE